tara:strand:- start:926 stop:1327 length:402 start_codon:yes stop_codon:yes gene_type:complete
MATNANWTVVFEDKLIIKQSGDAAGTSYTISDDSFWSNSKFSNIWAIQHGTSITSDEVEYRDETPHSSYSDANIGDINQFSSKWDSAHLAELQSKWDKSNQQVEDPENSDIYRDETSAEKISRLGARPTSYSS